MTYMDLLKKEEKINLPEVMINHIARAANMSKSEHSIPYEFFLSEVIAHFRTPVSKWKYANILNEFGE